MKNNLFKISQVAKFLSVTTTTLRYYESEGLITPKYIDKITKYRYYDVSNINTFAYILMLRDAGASMMQIKSYFNDQTSMRNIVDSLIEQQKKLQEKITFFEDIFCSFDKSNEVKEVTLKEVKYVKKDYIAINFEDAFLKVENFINESVINTSLTSNPVTFIEYDTLEFLNTNFKISIGIEVDDALNNMLIREKQKVIKIVHHGTYDTLPSSYEKMILYAQNNNLELKGNVYEYYHESINLRDNPNDFVTEIIMPIK